MNQQEKDKLYMQRALQLASLGGVNIAPNPMVGAVIVLEDRIIGEGYHQRFGEAHAEVNAVNSVKDKSILKEATIYVTLEPCAHEGKTPPCANLIVKHQFKRVVIACIDSNSEVGGKGVQIIQEAGIQVEIGVLAQEARALNRRFFTFHELKRPYLILKWAETKDGFFDRLPEQRAKGINWITRPRMKLFVHTWRSKEPAIMVGWKTINNDNPQLNVREITGPSPHRFIIDPHGKVDVNATVFTDKNPTTIISKQTREDLPAHVEVIVLANFTSENICEAIYNKGFSSVFVEGGATTHQYFIEQGLWDEAYVLIGDTTFKEGLPAPILKNKTLLKQETIGHDIVQHFHRTGSPFFE